MKFLPAESSQVPSLGMKKNIFADFFMNCMFDVKIEQTKVLKKITEKIQKTRFFKQNEK